MEKANALTGFVKGGQVLRPRARHVRAIVHGTPETRGALPAPRAGMVWTWRWSFTDLVDWPSYWEAWAKRDLDG